MPNVLGGLFDRELSRSNSSSMPPGGLLLFVPPLLALPDGEDQGEPLVVAEVGAGAPHGSARAATAGQLPQTCSREGSFIVHIHDYK